MAGIVAVVGAAIGSAITSVVGGYVIEMTVGDKHYSKRDASVDAVFGLIGLGSIKKVGEGTYLGVKYGRKVRQGRKAGKGTTVVTKYGIELGEITLEGASTVSKAGYGSAVVHSSAIVLAQKLSSAPSQIRGLGSNQKIDLRNPATIALLKLSRKSSKSPTPNMGKKCRCKDGSYSTRCCKS